MSGENSWTPVKATAWLLWREYRHYWNGITWLNVFGTLLEVTVPVMVLQGAPLSPGHSATESLLALLWAAGLVSAAANSALHTISTLYGHRAATAWQRHGRADLVVCEALLMGSLHNFSFSSSLPWWVAFGMVLKSPQVLPSLHLISWVASFALTPWVGSVVGLWFHLWAGGTGFRGLRSAAPILAQLAGLGFAAFLLVDGRAHLLLTRIPITGPVLVLAFALALGILGAVSSNQAVSRYRNQYVTQHASGQPVGSARQLIWYLGKLVVPWSQRPLRTLVTREFLRYWTHPLNWLRLGAWGLLTVAPVIFPAWFVAVVPRHLISFYPLSVWALCFAELLGVLYQGDVIGVQHVVLAGIRAPQLVAAKLIGLFPTIILGGLTSLVLAVAVRAGVNPVSFSGLLTLIMTGATLVAGFPASFTVSTSTGAHDESWADLIMDQVPLNREAVLGTAAGIGYAGVAGLQAFGPSALWDVPHSLYLAALAVLPLVAVWASIRVVHGKLYH